MSNFRSKRIVDSLTIFGRGTVGPGKRFTRGRYNTVPKRSEQNAAFAYFVSNTILLRRWKAITLYVSPVEVNNSSYVLEHIQTRCVPSS